MGAKQQVVTCSPLGKTTGAAAGDRFVLFSHGVLNRRKMLVPVLFVLGALMVLMGAGCSSEISKSEAAQDENAKTKVVQTSNRIMVEMEKPEQFPLFEVETRKVADEIRTNGVVAPDVNRSAGVLSLAGGRVSNIRVKLGDEVKKGQLLLQIHSPELASAFSDYQKAQADGALSRKQLERAQGLYAKGAIAQRELENAQNLDEKARVDIKRAANQITVLGGNPSHYSPILDLRAPISGTIVEQNVSGGAGVRSLDATPNLFTIADLSRVWVLCDLYEDNISHVNIGDSAEVRLNAYPDRPFAGRISNISRTLDPNTRSAKVRIELNNPGMIMRSGMFVTAIYHSQKQLERLVVPISAIARLHDKNWVFKHLNGNRFQKIEVQTGPPLAGNLQQIISGVQKYDKVVTNALQFFNASEVK